MRYEGALVTISRIYPHRRNSDGSYESICLTCFSTVSHADTETDLKTQEINHVCPVTVLSTRADCKREQLKFRVKHGHSGQPRLAEPNEESSSS